MGDVEKVAFCGLYCAECGKLQDGKCPGCRENEKASWCKVRECCLENDYGSCADCREFPDAMDCANFNNFFSKVFGTVFRSDRGACIRMIKEKGYDEFADHMEKNRLKSIRR